MGEAKSRGTRAERIEAAPPRKQQAITAPPATARSYREEYDSWKPSEHPAWVKYQETVNMLTLNLNAAIAAAWAKHRSIKARLGHKSPLALAVKREVQIEIWESRKEFRRLKNRAIKLAQKEDGGQV